MRLLIFLCLLRQVLPFTFLAQTLPGLENLLFNELSAISSPNLIPQPPTKPGGVLLSSPTVSSIYPLLLHSRIATKFLLQLSPPTTIDATPEAVYKHTQETIDPELLHSQTPNDWLTFSVNTTPLSTLPPILSHSKATAINIAKALTDLCLTRNNTRPNVDLLDPDLPLQAFLSSPGDTELTVSLYASLIASSSSHKLRHYRPETIHTASLKPTTAAALLLHAGWGRLAAAVAAGSVADATLFDPMCGSGTFLVEAGMIASRTPPLLEHVKRRGMCVMRWKGCERAVWDDVVREGVAGIRPLRGVRIVGSDINGGAVELARQTIAATGFTNEISLIHGSCDTVAVASTEVTMAICNPPWGGRLTADLDLSWSTLGATLKKLGGGEAWVLCPPSELTGLLKLRRERGMTFWAAKDKLRFTQYIIR